MAFTSSALLLLMLVTCSLVIIACSAQQFYASGRYGKRGSSTFWSGSRYGRIGGGIGRRQQSGGGSPVEVSARNDRFFIGSRYGKRSDETVPSAEPGINDLGGLSEVLLPSDEDVNSQVTCLYTGVTNLYRCFNRKDNASEQIVSPHQQ